MWDTLLLVLVQFSVLAVVVERSLYLVFDSTIWSKAESVFFSWAGDWVDLKPYLSAALSVWLCFYAHLDMIAALFPNSGDGGYTQAGVIVTGFFVAGGSKAVYTTFKRLRQLREAKQQAQIHAFKTEGVAQGK